VLEHTRAVWAVAVSEKFHGLVSGTSDGYVRLFDTNESCRQLYEIPPLASEGRESKGITQLVWEGRPHSLQAVASISPVQTSRCALSTCAR
jgi:WD40 repeat protein